ncbi:hypothetical protein PVAND_017457 [Polypedilum vanderplanki]|uniref:glutathione transferase n=1 Tax=Polypedilum vanderplanki TaxID=319348 RepID=A0A9J6BIM7_POLVA|nr:hypothetical protein PVAND_017457 [Polypedilum vanderplanki]
MSNKLVLYYVSSSPSCRAAYLVARELGLDVELKYINLFREDNLSPEYLAINPSGTVPSLVDGDVTVWDSHAIMIYLTEKFDNNSQLYPRDFFKRTLINERLFFEASYLFARLFEICDPLCDGREKIISQDKIDRVIRGYRSVEDFFFDDNQFIAAPIMTLADFSMWTTLITLNYLVPINEEKFPKLTKYLKMLEKHEGYEINRDGAERHANYVLKCLHGMEYNGKIAVEIFRESKNYSHIINEWDHITAKEFEAKKDENNEEEKVINKMSNLCRVCVTESSDTVELNEYRDGLPISVIVMIILPVKIYEGEELKLPKKICGKCLEIILNAYNLRSVSLNSEQFLKSNEIDIKNEVIEKPIEITEIKEKFTKFFDEPEKEQNEEIFSEQISIDLYMKNKKRSTCWQYFGRLLNEYRDEIDTDFNYCSLCLKEKKITKYKCSTATSAMIQHLQVIHRIGGQEAGSKMMINKVQEEYKQKTIIADKNCSEASETQCKICGKNFSNHHTLNKHLQTHSGPSFYSCDSCPARFIYLENLQRHQKVHDTNHFSQYICDICGNDYASKDDLHRHLQTNHVGNTSYTCKCCSASFRLKIQLKNHYKSHHKNSYYTEAEGSGISNL